jgi:hypothetical protein
MYAPLDFLFAATHSPSEVRTRQHENQIDLNRPGV